MTVRFTFETAIGAIYLALTIFLGQMAIWFFLLFTPVFFLPRMRRQYMDEREIQLFFRIGSFSTVFLFLSYILIEFLSSAFIYGHQVGDYRIQFCTGLFFLTRGLTGLFFLAKS